MKTTTHDAYRRAFDYAGKVVMSALAFCAALALFSILLLVVGKIGAAAYAFLVALIGTLICGALIALGFVVCLWEDWL